MVGGAAAAHFMSGISLYSTGLFLAPIRNAMGVSTSAVLFATTALLTLMAGVWTPLLGRLAHRVPLRLLLGMGLACIALGYFSLATATSLIQVALSYGTLLAFGNAAVLLAANMLVCNWFVVHRARGLGLAAAGISIAGLSLPPVIAHLLEAYSFPVACLSISAALAVMGPLLVVVLLASPEDAGQQPDNAAVLRDSSATGTTDSIWTLSQIYCERRFWVAALVVSVPFATTSAVIVNLVAIAAKGGLDAQSASYLISLAAMTAIFSKIGAGWLYDRIGLRFIPLVMNILTSCSCLLFFLADNRALMIVASVFLGAGLGATTIGQPVMASAMFGARSFGTAFGAMSPVWVACYISIISAAGSIVDRHGSYDLMLACGQLPLLIAGICCFALPRTRIIDSAVTPPPGGGSLVRVAEESGK
jgi:MFS family permease